MLYGGGPGTAAVASTARRSRQASKKAAQAAGVNRGWGNASEAAKRIGDATPHDTQQRGDALSSELHILPIANRFKTAIPVSSGLSPKLDCSLSNKKDWYEKGDGYHNL